MTPPDQPTTPKEKLRWYHLTPGRLLVALLVVEGILLLSERFQWFAFNEYKGGTVLIAVGVVGVLPRSSSSTFPIGRHFGNMICRESI